MKLPNCMIDFKLVQSLIYMLSSMGMLALLIFSISLLHESILSDLSFCPPPPVAAVGKETCVSELHLLISKLSMLFGQETCVSELQSSISKLSMLFGQQQRFMLAHQLTSKILRDDRRLLPKLSFSSFSPKLNKFEHPDTTSFLIFTSTLLASSSDSHKYLILSHLNILNSSTAPIRSITPLHTSNVSPEIQLISNLAIDEAARTRLLNTPSPHSAISKTLSLGSASAETSINSGQLFI
ncbi:hypothetical protein Hanom_Chr04g00283241 [Helianthus anomalus]